MPRHPGKGLEVRLHNITLAGAKLWSYLDEMEDDHKPGILCLTETQLMGLPLNRARRRARSLGWHWFSTPATATIRDAVEEEVGRMADAMQGDSSRNPPAFSHQAEGGIWLESSLGKPGLMPTMAAKPFLLFPG